VTNKGTRKIISIDEEKSNGCRPCVPACAEGALKIINGKASSETKWQKHAS
jgi:NAD-dependent dihydropyrimidine dehydrogenase PreA subunit